MNRLLASLLVILLVACAPNMGDPRPVSVPTAAFLASADVTADVVAEALLPAAPRIAFVAGPGDEAWFNAVASMARLGPVSGPATLRPDLAVAFLGMEVVGDTTIELTYEGGSFVLHDALYDLGRRHWLDLLAFEVGSADVARPILEALTAYIATDVMPGAAVAIAVAVPDAVVGDSVSRLLSPAFRGTVHCGASVEAVDGSGIRLYYGPEARIYCRDASVVSTAGGDRVQAALVAGRPR
jgi:hypothetical protein